MNATKNPFRPILACFVALFALALSGLAFAETEEELLAKRAHWQDRYRVLLKNQAILEDNIAKLRHNYAQAQRRNYPRGGAREAFREQADAQAVELDGVKQELESIFSEARAADVPPGWLFEVEEESFDPGSLPASPESEPTLDLDGRNPLYLDDE